MPLSFAARRADQKLRQYFENYGTVQEAFVSYDKHTGRPRGFGFVVFADPIIADKVSLPECCLMFHITFWFVAHS